MTAPWGIINLYLDTVTISRLVFQSSTDDGSTTHFFQRCCNVGQVEFFAQILNLLAKPPKTSPPCDGNSQLEV